MKKLEDIPKKTIYEAPEGYFDHLPGIIQSRVTAQKPSFFALPGVRLAWQIAVPVILGVAALIFVLQPAPPRADTPEAMLSMVDTEALAGYLAETDITTDELMDQIDLNEIDVDQLYDETFDTSDQLDVDELDDLIKEYNAEYF